MALAQLVNARQRVTGPAGARRRGDGEQRIGDLAHRRHDNHRAAPVARPRGPDNLDQATDSFWIGDRRAAKFLYDHVSTWQRRPGPVLWTRRAGGSTKQDPPYACGV